MKKHLAKNIKQEQLIDYIYQRTLDTNITRQITRHCAWKNTNTVDFIRHINTCINITIRAQEAGSRKQHLKHLSSEEREVFLGHMALRSCSLRQQEIISLHTYLNLKPEEVSWITRLPIKTIRNELRKGLEQIDHKLTQLVQKTE